MHNELWPTMPIERTEPGVPDFPRWGEAAPFVALSERLYSKPCMLASDIDEFGTRVSDPAVVNHIVNRLAFMGSRIADIVHSLPGKLDRGTRMGRPFLLDGLRARVSSWPPLRLVRLRCERVSVGVVPSQRFPFNRI